MVFYQNWDKDGKSTHNGDHRRQIMSADKRSMKKRHRKEQRVIAKQCIENEDAIEKTYPKQSSIYYNGWYKDKKRNENKTGT